MIEGIDTIELVDGRVVLQTTTRQILLTGEFNKRMSKEEVIRILKKTQVPAKIAESFAEVRLIRHRNIQTFLSFSYGCVNHIKGAKKKCIIVDVSALPLFVYKLRFYKNKRYTVIVLLNEKSAYIVSEKKRIVQKVLLNFLNQGNYSLLAARLSMDGGRMWYCSSNTNSYEGNLSKLIKWYEGTTLKAGGIVVTAHGKGNFSCIHYDLRETLRNRDVVPLKRKDFNQEGIENGKNVSPSKNVNPFGYVTFLKIVNTRKIANRKIYLARANISIPDMSQKPLLREMNIGGISTNKETATLKAYVEAAERYCGGDVLSARATSAPMHSFFEQTKSIIGFDPTKKLKRYGIGTPSITYSRERLYPAVKSYELLFGLADLHLGKRVLLPVDLVYYPVGRQREDRFTFANSSGCAGHTSYVTAIENAILELSERDSLMLMWLNKFTLPRIKHKSLPHGIHERVEALEFFSDKEVCLLDATLDKQAPHIISVVFDRRGKYPCLHLGAGTSLTLDSAISKALQEIETTVFFSSVFKGNNFVRISAENVSSVRHHYMYYHDPNHWDEVSFVVDGDEVSYSDVSQAGTLGDVLQKGGEWYVCNLTNRHFYNQGVRVVRVLSTEFVPIWFGNKCLPMDKKRIQNTRTTFAPLQKHNGGGRHLFLHPMG